MSSRHRRGRFGEFFTTNTFKKARDLPLPVKPKDENLKSSQNAISSQGAFLQNDLVHPDSSIRSGYHEQGRDIGRSQSFARRGDRKLSQFSTERQDEHGKKPLDHLEIPSLAESPLPARFLSQDGIMSDPPPNLYHDLIQQLDDVKDGILQLESDHVRSVQQHAFRRFEPPGWEPETFEAITRKLHRLDDLIKHWSAEYGIKNIPYEEIRISAEITSVVSKVSYLDFDHLVERLPQSGVKVLLQSFVSCIMYLKIFSDPFFGVSEPPSSLKSTEKEGSTNTLEPEDTKFQDEVKTGSSEGDLGAMLTRMYKRFQDCSIVDAAAWRVQTLRQLNPLHDKQYSDARRTSRLSSRERMHSAQKLAVSTINLVIPLLRKMATTAEVERMHEQLGEIFHRAADISLSIWVQHQDFKTEDMTNSKFEYGHRLMEPHQHHARDLDSDSTAWDSQPIILVTSPAAMVQVHKDEDNVPSTIYILKRASCYLGTVRPVSGQPASGSQGSPKKKK